MSRKRPPLRAVLVIAACAVPQVSKAFEDRDCSRIATVETSSIQEPYRDASGYVAARDKALKRAYEQAATQAIGIWIESIQETKTEIKTDSATEEFTEKYKSKLAGFIKLIEAKEEKSTIAGQKAVLMTVKTLVCVPTPEVIIKIQRDTASPPRPVDPNKVAWFNAKDGSPKVWYRRDKDSKFFFYDNEGYDPDTGELLKPVSTKVREEWKNAEAAAAGAQAAIEQHNATIAAAPDNCDRLAGNPYDRGRSSSIEGATFDMLRLNVADAIATCLAAAQKSPNELRFQYQLARAFQVNDPKKALLILRKLKQRHYAAAFDNYGWALLDKRTGADDLGGALAAFREGAALGDPSSMYSLASLILDNKTSSPDYREAARLLHAASQLGHLGAQARLSEVDEAINSQNQQQQMQRETQEAVIKMLGVIIQNGIRN